MLRDEAVVVWKEYKAKPDKIQVLKSQITPLAARQNGASPVMAKPKRMLCTPTEYFTDYPATR